MWIALAVLAIARCVIHIFPDAVEDDADTAGFFAGTALIAGLIAFFIFLWVAKMPTQVWYFLPLTTFTAVCIDAAVANWPTRWQFWRCALAILALVCLPGARELTTYRQTNMDLVAELLRERAEARDLIIVHPWTFGISFDRQYSGPTPWTTVPPLADHRFHRYDLLKAKMILENPAQPVCDQVAATLRAGQSSVAGGRHSAEPNARHRKSSPRRTIRGDGWTILTLTSGARRSATSSRCTPPTAKSSRCYRQIR